MVLPVDDVSPSIILGLWRTPEMPFMSLIFSFLGSLSAVRSLPCGVFFVCVVNGDVSPVYNIIYVIVFICLGQFRVSKTGCNRPADLENDERRFSKGFSQGFTAPTPTCKQGCNRLPKTERLMPVPGSTARAREAVGRWAASQQFEHISANCQPPPTAAAATNNKERRGEEERTVSDGKS